MVSTSVSIVERRSSRLGRWLLFSMFMVLMMDRMPGLDIGIGSGLSAKNLYLYSIVLFIAVRAAASPSGVRFVDLDVNLLFWFLLIYAILTWGVVSVTNPTYSPMRGVITIKNQIVDLYLFMFAFRYGIDRREDYLWLLRAILVTVFVSSFVAFIDYANIPDLGLFALHKGRADGPLGAANQYGAMLAFLIPISIAAIPEFAGKLMRWFWYSGIVANFAMLIATGSRGAYLATLVGAIGTVIYLRDYLDMKRVLNFAGTAFVVLVAMLAGFAIFNYDFLAERFLKTTSEPVVVASSGRADIWMAALLLMVERPISFIFGYGWNAYEISGMWKNAHNEYLDKLYELGIIGLAAFVLLLRSTVARVRRAIGEVDPHTRQLMTGYVYGMMVVFVAIFFVTLPDPWSVIWIVTGLMMGIQATAGPRESSQR